MLLLHHRTNNVYRSATPPGILFVPLMAGFTARTFVVNLLGFVLCIFYVPKNR